MWHDATAIGAGPGVMSSRVCRARRGTRRSSPRLGMDGVFDKKRPRRILHFQSKMPFNELSGVTVSLGSNQYILTRFILSNTGTSGQKLIINRVVIKRVKLCFFNFSLCVTPLRVKHVYTCFMSAKLKKNLRTPLRKCVQPLVCAQTLLP